MQVTLSRVVEAARQRKAAVTAEAGGYIILLAVQRLAAEPRLIDAELIHLTAAGEILIDGSAPAHAAESEAALRRLLATLVSLSQTAPPALRAAAERPATGGLAALESELTAALIPINHAASGRALARLFRETEKALRGSPSSAAAALTGASDSSRPSVPSSDERVASTPLPSSAHLQPVPLGATVLVPEPSTLAEPALLDIDVELDAGDAEEQTPGGVAPIVAAAVAAPADVRSEAPQLVVEELDELDVLDLGVDEPAPLAVPAAPAAELVLPTVDEAPPSSESLAAEVPEVADELDALLAAELPPPFTSEEPCLEASAMSGEVGRPEDVEGPHGRPQPTSLEPPAHRSDLRELLNGFLAHTRCEEEMAANLRRMLGLEPWRASGAATGTKMGPAEAPVRLI